MTHPMIERSWHIMQKYGLGKYFVCSLVCAFLFGWGNVASETPTLQQQFENELEALRRQYQFPGATAAFILPDGTVGAAAVGLADVENEIPMQPDSRMLAASIGKMFVSATVVALAQENKLHLDDPLSKWLGDRDWFSRLPNHKHVTLYQLLNHTSGIPNHVDLESFHKAFKETLGLKENPFPPEKLVSFVLDLQPLFEPGKGWHYTDTGYILLGLVIESASGNSYYDQVTKRLLKPLKLEFTSPSNRRELCGLAAGYVSHKNEFGLAEKTMTDNGVLLWHPGLEWTGGGLISNSQDLVIWAKALFDGEAIDGDYLEILLKSVRVSRATPDVRYGLGIGIYRNGKFGLTYGHGGWIPGYCSSLRYYADHGVAVAFQINTDRILDCSKPVVEEMEIRLAEKVIKSLKK